MVVIPICYLSATLHYVYHTYLLQKLADNPLRKGAFAANKMAEVSTTTKLHYQIDVFAVPLQS